MSDTARTLHLYYEPPLDWGFALHFLGERATAGVEWISERTYTRTAAIEGDAGIITVKDAPERTRLDVTIVGPLRNHEEDIALRVRRMFDLDLDLKAVADVFRGDPIIGPLHEAYPGLRRPGAWSPFEALLRTIVGQQVSVAAATTIAGRVADRTGGTLSPSIIEEGQARVGDGAARLTRLFPEPDAVAGADLTAIGMPGRRVGALQTVARHMADGRVPLPTPAGHPGSGKSAGNGDNAGAPTVADTKAALIELPGIGPWTAELFALRALGDRDAWPVTDLILRRELEQRAQAASVGDAGRCGDAPRGAARPDAAALRTFVARAAERWRPFRAYAALHLWRAAAEGGRSKAQFGN